MDSIVTPKLGVLFNTDRLSGPDLIDYAKRIEGAGIDSVWLAELFGREPVVAAATLLAHTDVLSVGTAIANIYARDATATAAAAATLAEVSNNRFQLGLGVSNRGLIEMRGHTWEPPVELLSTYLDQVRDAKIDVPPHNYPVWVAAHGPKMLGAASSRADGVFTYLMNSAHTARTAATLEGLDSTAAVSPMMMCLRCQDPIEARQLARKAIAFYMTLDYYHRAWRSLGFDDTDFADGGSDRLVDAIVAWGSVDAIHERIAAQHDAGAAQVVVIPLNAAGGVKPDWDLLTEIGRNV